MLIIQARLVVHPMALRRRRGRRRIATNTWLGERFGSELMIQEGRRCRSRLRSRAPRTASLAISQARAVWWFDDSSEADGSPESVNGTFHENSPNVGLQIDDDS